MASDCFHEMVASFFTSDLKDFFAHRRYFCQSIPTIPTMFPGAEFNDRLFLWSRPPHRCDAVSFQFPDYIDFGVPKIASSRLIESCH